MRRARAGFSLLELVLVVALFGVFSLAALSAYIYGRESTTSGAERLRASQLATEAVEAVRNIDANGYSNLTAYTNGTVYYLTTVSNQWTLVTTPAYIDSTFTRTLVFSDGPNGTRQLTVSVNWPENFLRQGSVQTAAYFANWKAATAQPTKTGIFVYANGGTSSDRMTYRLMQTSGQWTAAADMPDVDAATGNRVARSVKLYSAQTGSAKMVLSRHYDGTNQYMYGTYWNGTSFATPKLLASWNDASTTYINSGNYSGSFLADGTFVAVYQDRTNVPKFRTFNGASWSSQGNLPSLGASGQFPVGIVTKARPSSNEAMTILLNSDSTTATSYFASGAWSSYTTHGSATTNLSKVIDLDWSPVDKTKAAITFTSSSTQRTLTARVFTANGSGGGSWAAPVSSATQPTSSTIGSLGIFARAQGVAEFMACDKDEQTTPSIYCYTLNATTNVISSPTNNLITNATDTGGQRSFDLGYELLTGASGVNAYSDNTASGKLKTYDSTTRVWSTSAISMPSAASTIQKTRLVSKPNSDDCMVVLADANKNLYSVVYNGTTNSLYTAPAGEAWTSHNTNGPSNSAVWFDFAWDS